MRKNCPQFSLLWNLILLMCLGFSFSCSKKASTSSGSVINTPSPTPPGVCAFSAFNTDSTSINLGDSATLSWSLPYCTSGAYIDHGVGALSPASSGTASVSPTMKTTYTIRHQSTTLHSMSSSDGSQPTSELILSGGKLYGIASYGGAYGIGTIFSLNSDGSNFSILYEFNNGLNGAYPAASLIILGSTLYGVTSSGGQYNNGTIFKINTDGSGFSTIHHFDGINGQNPSTQLALSGTTLYGITNIGGANSLGIIFSIEVNGSAFTVLKDFDSSAYSPIGGLSLSGGKLYGVVQAGGGSGNGMIYSINPDGTGFNGLYDFPASNGQSGRLLIDSGKIYSSNSNGGVNFTGQIFSMNTDGTGFTSLHDFNNDTNSGLYPIGALALHSGILYGVSSSGGTNNMGIIYKVKTDGTDYGTLYDFTGTVDDGSYPSSGLIVDSGILYGATTQGGSDGIGTIYGVSTTHVQHQITIDVTSNLVIHTFASKPDGSSPTGELVLYEGQLYGITNTGGDYDYGSIFRIDTSGGNYSIIHSFNKISSLGTNPAGGIVIDQGFIYGVTNSGGAAGMGTVYRIQTDGSGMTILHDFLGIDGASPNAPLTLNGGVLFGSTSSDSYNNGGTLFRVNTDGSHFSTLYIFDPTVSAGPYYPTGQLVYDSGIIYGTTYQGGTNGGGTIFSISADGHSFNKLYDFGTSSDSETLPTIPEGGLTLVGGNKLFGMTTLGGASAHGTIYSWDIWNRTFTTIHEFSNSERPSTRLTVEGSKIYGFTTGFKYTSGTIFSMNDDGSGLTTHYTFTQGVDGWHPSGAPVVSGGQVFGISMDGGANSLGTIFKIPVP